MDRHLDRRRKIDNYFMKASLKQAMDYAEGIVQALELAALTDDGAISSYEKRVVKKVKKATQVYVSKLKKLG